MERLLKKVSATSGLVPGTLVHVGERKQEKVKISVLDYNETDLDDRQFDSVDETFSYKDKSTVTWIDICGVHDVDQVSRIGNHYGLHPLVLEDIVDTSQRPKLEDFEDYLFVVLKMLYFDPEEETIISEQVSLVLGKDFVISFQEQEGDVFGPVRDRIRRSKGRIRKAGADYLAYSLIDAIVDNYFSILESFGEDIEHIEEDLAKDPKSSTLHIIHILKRDAIRLRKSVWPLREVVGTLQRGGSPLISDTTGVYLHDVYDHIIQVIDTTESFRDMVSGMLDIYLSSVSNRMNEVMKVLTIFAAIFIPLTFIAGIYGMNFKYMPELEWRWAYFGVLGLMAVVAGTLLIFFKRQKWL